MLLERALSIAIPRSFSRSDCLDYFPAAARISAGLAYSATEWLRNSSAHPEQEPQRCFTRTLAASDY